MNRDTFLIPAMKNVILTKETNQNTMGENSIYKEFGEKHYFPTVIDQLVTEKATKDLNTIKEALSLLEMYRYNGVSDFDVHLQNILNIEQKKQ